MGKGIIWLSRDVGRINSRRQPVRIRLFGPPQLPEHGSPLTRKASVCFNLEPPTLYV